MLAAERTARLSVYQIERYFHARHLDPLLRGVVPIGIELPLPLQVRLSGQPAAVVALAPMVWAFGRLHRNAPSAGSTSDVVGKVLGGRTGLFTGLLQLAGYLLLAVGIARGPGIAVALLLVDDVESVTTSWWWPVCAIAAAILAARRRPR